LSGPPATAYNGSLTKSEILAEISRLSAEERSEVLMHLWRLEEELERRAKKWEPVFRDNDATKQQDRASSSIPD
jgi:hypothetical protein